jgi:hypothetical protein
MRFARKICNILQINVRITDPWFFAVSEGMKRAVKSSVRSATYMAGDSVFTQIFVGA